YTLTASIDLTPRRSSPTRRSSDLAWYTIDMGQWSLDPTSPVLVTTGGIDVARPGLRVSTGNPHTVVALAETAELEAADLRDAPRSEDHTSELQSRFELVRRLRLEK